ncbi:MAG TPA: 3-dehydroquinate synthase [Candidatus Hydrogenedentes bacterium]|nr:3-dehydroquinate synthase [Candidatus Hydrogenedentota bacterium]HPG67459.1 3-dehydroquinate synthase [Candidatus Hydrogenedentota bacterium]
MQTIEVALGERAYPILIGRGAIDQLPDVLARLEVRGAIRLVTDTNVGPLYGQRVVALASRAGMSVTLSVLPAGEEHKRLSAIERLCGDFLEAGLDRAGLVIALGGGVVGDVAGFAASTYMRGIPFVQIPTTIVAQVDSSVGGKTGVNHALGKNIIGAFHQPSAVLVDLDLLHSLPDRELRAGLAEAIKHGVIADADLFEYMERHAAAILAKDLDALGYPILRSCAIKAAVVAEDELERGQRAILNYGHTFGHGFEAATHYARFLHGEAIALGMHAAGLLSRNVGLVDDAFVARQRACLEAYGLPVAWPDMPVDEVYAAMRHDKKAQAGTLRFVLASGMGHVVQRKDITEPQVRAVLVAVGDGLGKR